MRTIVVNTFKFNTPPATPTQDLLAAQLLLLELSLPNRTFNICV
uniref:Uncharacterized protein n=1 Tax=Rhizophora mucronata TaxID=61149 RepID=A0A2P2PPB8_RHIMU